MKYSIVLLFVFTLFIQASCNHKPQPTEEDKVPDIEFDNWVLDIPPDTFTAPNGVKFIYYIPEARVSIKKTDKYVYKYTVFNVNSNYTGNIILKKPSMIYEFDTLMGNEGEIGKMSAVFDIKSNRFSGNIDIDVFIDTLRGLGYYQHLNSRFTIY